MASWYCYIIPFVCSHIQPVTPDPSLYITLGSESYDTNNMHHKPIYYREGDYLTYICTTKHPPLVVTHKVGEYEITKIEGKEDEYSISLVLVMTKFDNKTNINCYAQGMFEMTTMIWNGLTNPLNEYLIYDKDMVSPYPDNGTHYINKNTIYCNHHLKKSWLRIIGNKIDIKYNPPKHETYGVYKKALKLTTADNDSSFICTSYKKDRTLTLYYRHVSPLCNIIVNRETLEETNTVAPYCRSLRKPRFFFSSLDGERVTGDVVVKLGDNIYKGWEHSPLYYTEGALLQFQCLTNPKRSSLRIVHKKGNYEISKIYGRDGEDITISLVMTRFDNDTSIYCVDKRGLMESYTFYLNTNSTQNEVEYDNDMVTPRISENASFVKGEHLSCKAVINARWYRIKDNTFDVEYIPQYYNYTFDNIVPLKLNDSDHGTSFICMTFKKQLHTENYTRHMSKIININMHAGIRQPEGLEVETWSNTMIYLIVAGAGLMILIITGITWKFCRKSPPTPLEVETYACTYTVQYVDLQAMPSNRNVITRENTPYAQIVGVLEPENK